MAKVRHYEYDVFVSHAVEDKIGIATALQEALKAKGIRVWYSGEELSVGDRLIDTIYKGLDECRFGVVILSPTYLGKIWALGEFFFFLTRDEKGSKVILPVLYDITPEELAVRYPLMADIVAVKASLGLEHVVQKLHDVIMKETARETPPKRNWSNFRRYVFSKRVILSILFLSIVLGLVYLTSLFFEDVLPGKSVMQAIQNHVSITQKKADEHLQQFIQSNGGREVHGDSINKIYADYKKSKSYYRNEYMLTNGESTIRAKRNVDKALEMDVSTMTPANGYLFPSPRIYRGIPIVNNGNRLEEYLFYNTAAVEFSIAKTARESGIYYITVKYTQPVRCVFTSLVFPLSPTDTKRQQVIFTGLRPVEVYVFKEVDGSWTLQGIE